MKNLAAYALLGLVWLLHWLPLPLLALLGRAFGLLLQTPAGAGFWVATTHLHWDPRRSDLKFAQAVLLRLCNRAGGEPVRTAQAEAASTGICDPAGKAIARQSRNGRLAVRYQPGRYRPGFAV